MINPRPSCRASEYITANQRLDERSRVYSAGAGHESAAHRPPPELPMLLPLDPLVDVARDPVVDVPVEPITGVLGTTAALLGAVLPVAVLGGLPLPKGVT